VKTVISRLKPSFGLALAVGVAGSLTLGGCDSVRVPPPWGEGTGTPLTEYAEPIGGPSSEGPLAVLRSAVQPIPDLVVANTDKVRLGRRLFHDPVLSGDNTISCASCHSLDRGGADGRRSSLGIHNQVGPINSPTVLNARFHFVQFWDGRATDLRDQAGGPMTNALEMGNTWDGVLAALGRTPPYRELFQSVYPDGVTQANVRDAIATYEETLVTPSRFDRWLKGADAALTADERAGAELFVTTGCVTCHQGVALGGTSFQRLGAVGDYFAFRGTPLTEADNGRYNVTHNEADRHFFKVPTLRNVELTAPYFHDGSRETLEDAVRVMARFQLGRPLEDAQVNHLVAFLKSLTGEIPAEARLPPGELPPPAAPNPANPATLGAPGVVGPGAPTGIRPAAPALPRPAAPAAPRPAAPTAPRPAA